MSVFLAIIGLLMVVGGAFAFVGAPAITQEILAMLAVGFGMVLIGLAELVSELKRGLRILRDIQARLPG